MTIEDDIAFLSQVPVLRRLGAPALRILAIGAEAYSVEAGQTLFAAGDAELIAEPGALLGEGALLVQSQRPATAVAREDAVVLRISRTMFLRMLDSYPEAAQRLRELIAARADQWAREMDDVRAALARDTGPRS